MNILGISAFHHDSAACLVQDGAIVAAAQEERFTRRKHDREFPRNAAEYCVAEAGIGLADLDLVAFYDKPLLQFDRLLETYVAYSPAGFKLFTQGLPRWLKHKLHIPRELDRGLGGAYTGRYVFTEHHEAHAASAFFPSPYEEAVILTLDGVGEWATGSISVGRGNRIEMKQELRFPHSLGLLYSAFTYFTGFEVNGGEYKLMGLAPYGAPVYRDRIVENLLDLRDDGSFRLDMDYFAYCHDDVMTSPKMAELFDGPPRARATEITQREMDLAASIQAVTEEIVMRIARHAHAQTGMRNLVLAGGVALNCVANGKLLRDGPYDGLWIQPAAGDAGGALGAALFVWHQLLEKPRDNRGKDAQRGSLLGPGNERDGVKTFLDSVGAVYHHHRDEPALCEAVAELIAAGRVVGHVAGRMEFGPRALGNRSILGDPRSREMQSVMNLKIKFRESFRPFAPAVLAEHVHEFFELRAGQSSPYMLLVARVQRDKLTPPAHDGAKGLAKLAQVRSLLPAITHVDDSARVQTIDAEQNPRFHAIVSAFARRTGCPVVINTSFNVRDEPIVNTAQEAYRCFMATHMDALVVEDVVLLKEEQPNAEQIDRQAYLREFADSSPSAVSSSSKLLDLQLHPDVRTLRHFGVIALGGFGLLAACAFHETWMFAFGLGAWRNAIAIALATLAGAAAFFSLVQPRANRALYVGVAVLAYPLGLVMSYALLSAVFFLIFVPIGALLRAFGRDPLQRAFDPRQHSYWSAARPSRSKASYFRQF